MNPVNFSNMGNGAMPTGANPQSNLQNQVSRQIAASLQSQGPFTGWRAEVPLQDRAGKVWQMITSLRLIQPRLDTGNVIQGALTYEEKAFREANQKDDYEKECAAKLHAIKETRLRQQAVYNQGGLMQHGGAGGMPGAVRPNGVPPQFNPQGTRPMQTSPISGQMPLNIGLNDPNMIQQQQQQLQQHQQQLLAQNQMVQQRLASGLPMTDELSMLSQSEFEQISQMTAVFISKLSADDIERRRAMWSRSVNPETKQMITQKYGDFFTYMMRVQLLRTMKARQNQNRNHMARSQGLDSNSIVGGDQMLNLAQRQMTPNTMGLQRNSALQMNNQQSLDPSSFIGNVENIQGQQADGLRSQEAGQLVVPASTAPISSQPSFANPNGLFQQGALPQMAQSNLNRPVNPQQMLAQQQLQNAQNAQQERIQQTPQFQAPNQVQNTSQAQARAQAQAAQNGKMAMSTQAGGKNTTQLSQNLPHQSPAMSMLNRPVGPNMSPAQSTAGQARPPSRQPGVNGQQLGNQQGMRPQIPPNLPPALQERLAQMTPEQVSTYMATQRRALANSQQAARMNGQSLPMQTSMSQQSQGGAFNDPNMRTTMSLQQSLNGIAGGPQNNPLLQGQQQISLQQQQLLRQQQQMMRSQNQNFEMSPEQIREMDRVPFPPGMINTNQNMNPPVPKTVKTWGQLKGWVVQNPQVLGNVDLAKLVDLQRLHFAHTMSSHQREAGRNIEQNGQPNWAGNPQAFMPGQNGVGRSQSIMSPGPPVTAAEIHMARRKIGPQSQQLTDEQVKTLIMKHRHKTYMQQLQARGLSTQQMNQNQPTQQTSVPTPAMANALAPPLPPTTTQASQPSQQSQASQAASAKVQQTPAANKSVKAAAATSKTASKKRPHSDDIIEIQNPKSQAATTQASAPQPTSTTSVAPARVPPPLTKEQLAALSPKKRAQLEAQMKRPTARSQLSRAAAEENWNHSLPEQLQKWYTQMVIAKPAPSGHLDPISAEDKALMAQQLRENTDMLSRMDNLVPWLLKIPNQEKNMRALFLMRMQLMKQFKSTDWTPNEDFTVSPQYLTKSITMIKNMFSSTISKVQNQQQIQQSRASVSQANDQSHGQPLLNASNLQQLDEEAKRVRRASHNVPTAPTTAQPPFPLGSDPSPQGVPQAYGPGGFSPDKMKIPPSKRRKQSHPSVPTSQGAAGSKTASKADTLKAGSSFKCPNAECEYNAKGFSTQTALNKHVEDEHKAKEEVIEDPLKFALDSFDAALGAPTQNVVAADGDKEKKAGSGDATLIKLEAKPEAVTGATPMSRLISQTDSKLSSPASQNQRLQSAKTTKAPVVKKAKVGGNQEAAKLLDQPIISDDLGNKDGWADSQVSLGLIQETFDIPVTEDYPGFGGDCFDEFLNTDMFTLGQSEDTPDSVDSNGLVTQTPKDGEVVKEDSTIQIQDLGEDDRYPIEWFSHPGPMFSGTDDPWMDWDTVTKQVQANPLENGLSFSVT